MARLGFHIDPGALDRKITIKTFTAAQDVYGEEVLVWSTLAEVWAFYEPMSGSEKMDANQEIAVYDARFTIRFRSDVTRKMVVEYGGSTYDIENLAEAGRNQFLQLHCRARV